MTTIIDNYQDKDVQKNTEHFIFSPLKKQIGPQEQAIAREKGLFPQSGDWSKPFRWVKGIFTGDEEKEDERFQDFKDIISQSLEYNKQKEALEFLLENRNLSERKIKELFITQDILSILNGVAQSTGPTGSAESRLSNYEFKFGEDGKLKSFGVLRTYDTDKALRFFGSYMLPLAYKESLEGDTSTTYGAQLTMDVMRRFITEELDRNKLIIPQSEFTESREKMLDRFGFRLENEDYRKYGKSQWFINREDAVEAYNKMAKKFNVDEIQIPSANDSHIKYLMDNKDAFKNELENLEEEFFSIDSKRDDIENNLQEIANVLDDAEENPNDYNKDHIKELEDEFQKLTLDKYRINESLFLNELKNDFFILVPTMFDDFGHVNEEASATMQQILSDENFVYNSNDEKIKHIKTITTNYHQFNNEIAQIKEKSTKAAKIADYDVSHNFANDILFLEETSRKFNSEYSIDSISHLINLWDAQNEYVNPTIPSDPALNYWSDYFQDYHGKETDKDIKSEHVANKYLEGEHNIYNWQEAYAISQYSLGSFNINNYLYQKENESSDIQENDSFLAKTVRDIDSGFDKLPLNKEEIVVYRGVRKNNFANIIDIVKNSLQGMSFPNKTFISTSRDYEIAKGFASGESGAIVSDAEFKETGGQVFRFVIPPNMIKALDMNDVSQTYEREEETVLPRNINLRVVSGPGTDPAFPQGYTIGIVPEELEKSSDYGWINYMMNVRGLVPQSGDPLQPKRWVSPEEQEGQNFFAAKKNLLDSLQVITTQEAKELDYLQTKDIIEHNINLALNFFDMEETAYENKTDSPFSDEEKQSIANVINTNLNTLYTSDYVTDYIDYNNSVDDGYVDDEDLAKLRMLETEFSQHTFFDHNRFLKYTINFEDEEANELIRKRRYSIKKFDDYQAKKEETDLDLSFGNFFSLIEYQKGSFGLNQYAYIRNERLFSEDKNTSVLGEVIKDLDDLLERSGPPSNELTLFRGLPQNVYNIIKELHEEGGDGVKYLNKPFMSTSTSHVTAGYFGPLVKVIVPTDIPVFDFVANALDGVSTGENEVLIPRNTEFSITKDDEDYTLTAVGRKKFEPGDETLQKSQKIFNVELAHDNAIGLSGRDNMDNDSGMLFILPENIEPIFSMNDMKFPLDFICADKNNSIVYIERNVEPSADVILKFPDETKFVIEVNADTTQDLSIGESINYLQKQQAQNVQEQMMAREKGLVPQSGDWNKPLRWIRPNIEDTEDDEQYQEQVKISVAEFTNIIRNSFNFDEEMDALNNIKDDDESKNFIKYNLESLNDLINIEGDYNRENLEDLEALEFKFGEDNKLKAMASIEDNEENDEFEIQSVISMPTVYKNTQKNKVGYGVQLMVDLMRRFLTESRSDYAINLPLNDNLVRHYKKLFGFDYKEPNDMYLTIDRNDALRTYNRNARFFGVKPLNEREIL